MEEANKLQEHTADAQGEDPLSPCKPRVPYPCSTSPYDAAVRPATGTLVSASLHSSQKPRGTSDIISALPPDEPQDTNHSCFSTKMTISRLQQNPDICSPQADMGCIHSRQFFCAKTLQITLYGYNCFTRDSSALDRGRKRAFSRANHQAAVSQPHSSHTQSQEHIELMRSLRLEPISHCLQLEGKHAGSDGN